MSRIQIESRTQIESRIQIESKAIWRQGNSTAVLAAFEVAIIEMRVFNMGNRIKSSFLHLFPFLNWANVQKRFSCTSNMPLSISIRFVLERDRQVYDKVTYEGHVPSFVRGSGSLQCQ